MIIKQTRKGPPRGAKWTQPSTRGGKMGDLGGFGLGKMGNGYK